MDSGMIGKIEKAHRYTAERTRFQVSEMSVRVRGDNSEHLVTLDAGRWACNCDYYEHHSTCAHTMALELMLDGMVAQPALAAV